MYELEQIQKIVADNKLGLDDLIITSGYSESEVDALQKYLKNQTNQSVIVRSFTKFDAVSECIEDDVINRINVLYDIQRVAKYCKQILTITTDYRDVYHNETVDKLKASGNLPMTSWYLSFPMFANPIMHLHKNDNSSEVGLINVVDDDIISAFKKAVEAFVRVEQTIQSNQSNQSEQPPQQV